MKVLITGANGHLGRRLASRLVNVGEVVAAVRSERAKNILLAHKDLERATIALVDYGDPDSLARAAEGCQAVVHLVGILKESAGNRYEDAHEGSCRALVEAVNRAGVERVICVSILGSDLNSDNAFLASRA
ncbi:MAG: SDR family NAD(P)-dependent oxidoreductase, partial [Pseudomonadales bacterium]|nr:SDR family NAD(P)-dependent oxidoreductase [Pseudomonadales bacterium]